MREVSPLPAPREAGTGTALMGTSRHSGRARNPGVGFLQRPQGTVRGAGVRWGWEGLPKDVGSVGGGPKPPAREQREPVA